MTPLSAHHLRVPVVALIVISTLSFLVVMRSQYF